MVANLPTRTAKERSKSMSPLISKGLKLSAAVVIARALLRRTRKIDFGGRTVVISG
jgi:hypothetical protein